MLPASRQDDDPRYSRKGADAELTRDHCAAAERPNLILGADATYSDWHLLRTLPMACGDAAEQSHLPATFDGSVNFFGQGRTIASTNDHPSFQRGQTP